MRRLHLLGHLAHEVDRQQAVVERGAGDRHVIGKLEAPCERAHRKAAMEIFHLVLFLALPRDDEKVRLVADVEIVLGKAGDGEPHPIGVLVASLDVIGGQVSTA